MRPVLVLGLIVSAHLMAGGASGGKVEYLGGTVGGLREGAGGRLRTTDQEYCIFDTGKERLAVPYERINLLEYGQKVDRRYALAVAISPMFLLSKGRRHFLTIGYTDDDGRQQAMVFRVDKDDVRTMLVTLEARTGRRVQYQDEEARKGGKG
jgi:hypothetical protein